MQINKIIFDFDGTIADSLEILIDTISYVLNNYGYENLDISKEKIRKNSIKELFKSSNISLLKLPFILNSINKQLSDKIEFIKPIAGITDIIKELNIKNFNLNIISSNNSENIKKFLKNNDLNDVFDNIYTERSVFGKHKVINKFLNKYNLKKENIIYIGDEVRDILAAKQSGIKIIAVSWGFNEANMLERYSPDFIAYNPTDILNFFKN